MFIIGMEEGFAVDKFVIVLAAEFTRWQGWLFWWVFHYGSGYGSTRGWTLGDFAAVDFARSATGNLLAETSDFLLEFVLGR